ncbi:hypothetical protein ACSBR1_017386 [Camellia fascicularis]
MKLRKEFSQELNEDGLSPLHIASANGHVEIVKELLKADHKLCLVKGRERRIPLHYAAIKGRVNVIRELILASANSVVDMTARGETVLHLAVKNNQFEAFKDLVEHLKKFNKEATYQTVHSPPGSVWADDSMSSNNNSNNNVSKPHKAGQAIMGSKNWVH